MLKRTSAFILIRILMLGALCSCRMEQSQTKEPALETPDMPDTPPAVTPPEDPTPVTPPEDTFTPYIEKLEHSYYEIFTGPGYQYPFVSGIDAGAYTIVEEATDEHGNLWGKLKSGAGWIDLTYIRTVTNVAGPITISEGGVTGTPTHQYQHPGNSQGWLYTYTTKEIIYDISLYAMELGEGVMVPGQLLYSIEELRPEETFVAGIAFWGDLTTYGFYYKDAAGNTHRCDASISGRDGSLILQEVD